MRQFYFDINKHKEQLKQLKTTLERKGWTLVNEFSQIFKNRSNFDVRRQKPRLLGTWSIQRRTSIKPIIIEFSGGWDAMGYDLDLTYIDQCIVLGTDLELDFYLEPTFKTKDGKKTWRTRLKRFIANLDIYEAYLVKHEHKNIQETQA